MPLRHSTTAFSRMHTGRKSDLTDADLTDPGVPMGVPRGPGYLVSSAGQRPTVTTSPSLATSRAATPRSRSQSGAA
jgi:hypothetical protein